MAQHHHFILAPDGADNREQQHGQSSGFDAAAGGAGTGANKHQQHREHFCKFVLGGNVHRGKAGCAGIGRLEKGAVQLLQNIQPLHGVAKLQQEEAKGAKEKQDNGNAQADLRVEVQPGCILVVEPGLDFAQVNVLHHNKAQAADDNQKGDSQ